MPNGTDLTELMPLVIAIALVCAVAIIIDIVLLIRWLIYQVRLREAYENMAAMPVTMARITADHPMPATPMDFDLQAEITPEGPDLSGVESPVPDSMESHDAGIKAETLPAEPVAAEPPVHMDRTPEPVPLPTPPFAPTWSLTHPFLAIQFVLIAVNVVALILFPLFYLVESVRHLPQMQIIQGTITNVTIFALFLQNGLFVAVVSYCLRHYGTTLADMGLRRPTLRQIALGVGLGASMFLIATLLEGALSHTISPSNIKHLQKMTEAVDAGAMFEKLPSVWTRLLFAFAGAVLAPIGEEVFFRGLLYNGLKRRWNVPVAIVVSGLAFAAIHFNPLGLIVIFCMGMLLAYVYERTNSLWVTILMHAMNNGAAFAIAWFFPALGK